MLEGKVLTFHSCCESFPFTKAATAHPQASHKPTPQGDARRASRENQMSGRRGSEPHLPSISPAKWSAWSLIASLGISSSFQEGHFTLLNATAGTFYPENTKEHFIESTKDTGRNGDQQYELENPHLFNPAIIGAKLKKKNRQKMGGERSHPSPRTAVRNSKLMFKTSLQKPKSAAHLQWKG